MTSHKNSHTKLTYTLAHSVCSRASKLSSDLLTPPSPSSSSLPPSLSHSNKTCLTPLMCVYVCACACAFVCVCECSAAAQRLCCWASLLGLPHIFFKGAVRPQECHRGSGGSLRGAGVSVWVG